MTLIAAAVVLLSLGAALAIQYDITSFDGLLHAVGMKEYTPSTADASVHIIDVGQGDSILIKTKTKAVLIDAGENDCGQTVINYLKGQNIGKLDIVVGTHPHSDHIGGMDDVIDHMDVDKVILPKVKDSIVPTTKSYLGLLTSIENKGLTVTPAAVGSTYQLDDGLLEILSPDKLYDELNDTSVVLRFTYGDEVFLFMGDATETVEDDLLASGTDLKADVIKVGHHGSSTSSSKKFLKAVAPAYAAIPVGNDNSYNHPNKKVVQRYEDLGVQIYRSDRDGSIVFETDGKGIAVKTEKGSKTADNSPERDKE